jgi:hypothetical protein
VLTLLAICRRKGNPYKTGKKVLYHWNEEFLVAYINKLSTNWSHVFNIRIPRQNVTYADSIIESLRSFQQEIHDSVTRICGKYALARVALKQVPMLEDSIRSKVMDALKAGQDSAQTAHRAVGHIVRKHMIPYYVMADMIKGN